MSKKKNQQPQRKVDLKEILTDRPEDMEYEYYKILRKAQSKYLKMYLRGR